MEINDNTLLSSKLRRKIHNAMLMGTHRNKKFLQWLFHNQYLYFYSGDVSTRAEEEFFKLLDLFEAKYKDNWDLGFESFGSTGLKPYLKVIYPEFTITNSNRESHLIKDLVVIHRVAFSNRSNSVYTLQPQGGRLSKTKLEIASGYQQSHLPSHSDWINLPFHTENFCVGGDTDVNRMLAEFEIEMDWDRYELYLFCVDSMVTWESLEGVPYRKMNTIKNALNSMVTSVSESYTNDLINQIVANKIPLNVDFYVADGIFRIKPNEKANEFIKNIILQKYTYTIYKSILVTRVPNTFDQFLQMKTENSPTRTFEVVATNAYTIIKGKKMFAKNIKEDSRNQKPTPIEEYIVYPKFLKNVLNKLESRIYSKAVTKSGIKIYNSLDNADRSIAPDPVSMQIDF
jgi:hypothetical protein